MKRYDHDLVEALITAAAQVKDRWDSGNLAEAVTDLDNAVFDLVADYEQQDDGASIFDEEPANAN